MNRIVKLAMLLALILGNSTLLAQTRSGNLLNAAQDTLAINTAKDSLAVRKEIDVTADTLSYRLVVHYDSVRYNLKETYNKDAFKLKDDAFWEKMKDLRLSELFINVFFK